MTTRQMALEGQQEPPSMPAEPQTALSKREREQTPDAQVDALMETQLDSGSVTSSAQIMACTPSTRRLLDGVATWSPRLTA